MGELKIRVHGSGVPFGQDLLSYDLIEPGHHFWAGRPNNGEEMYDVQIIRQNGTPLLFTYIDRGGIRHEDQRFITINAATLHTLVIQEDDDGNLSFGYYETDQLDFGEPCNPR